MKIGFITELSLHQQFKNIPSEDELYIFCSLDDIKQDMDVVILDSRFILANTLINFINKKQSTTKYYYIFTEGNDSVKASMLKNMGVVILSQRLTEKQIFEKIYQGLYGAMAHGRNNVFLFFGADNKVGTSMIAQSIAEKLSQHESVRVLLAFLDGDSGTDYVENIDEHKSIDSVRAKVINHILSKRELMDICIQIKHLYILQGTSSIVYRKHYHPEHMETFLELLSETFDVVLLDIGSNIELGMTIGALNSTFHKFLICTQQNTCLRNFKKVDSQVLSKLDIKDFLMIINKYIDHEKLPSKYQLAEAYQMPFICSIPYSEYGLQADIEKCTILNFNEVDYVNAIEKIVLLIQESLGIANQKKEEKKSLFLKKIFNKREGVG